MELPELPAKVILHKIGNGLKCATYFYRILNKKYIYIWGRKLLALFENSILLNIFPRKSFNL